MSQDDEVMVMHGASSGYDGGDSPHSHYGGQGQLGVALLGPTGNHQGSCCGGSCGAGVPPEDEARRASGSIAWDDEPEVRVRVSEGTWVNL